jgi:hypothetical protein
MQVEDAIPQRVQARAVTLVETDRKRAEIGRRFGREHGSTL